MKRSCAVRAAVKAGICQCKAETCDEMIFDILAFDKFWVAYQEELAEKFGKEVDYLAEVLYKERQERANNRTKQRVQNLKFAVSFSLSFFFGALLTLILRL